MCRPAVSTRPAPHVSHTIVVATFKIIKWRHHRSRLRHGGTACSDCIGGRTQDPLTERDSHQGEVYLYLTVTEGQSKLKNARHLMKDEFAALVFPTRYVSIVAWSLSLGSLS